MKVRLVNISVLLYFFSFILPVFTDGSIYGFQAFFLSLLIITEEFTWFSIAWFANITFFLAFFSGPKTQKMFSLMSVFLALFVFAEKGIQVTSTHGTGSVLFLGYYAWLLSFALQFAGLTAERMAYKKKADEN